MPANGKHILTLSRSMRGRMKFTLIMWSYGRVKISLLRDYDLVDLLPTE